MIPVLLLVAVIIALLYFKPWAGGGKVSTDQLIREVVGSEEVILELSPKLGRLSHGLMNLSFPDLASDRALFVESPSVVDLSGEPSKPEALTEKSIASSKEFPIAEGATTVSRGELDLWRPLLERVDYFEHSAFKVVKGEFLGDRKDEFEGLVHFSGLAREKSGTWLGLSGDQIVKWEKKGGEWVIVAWRMENLLSLIHI